MIILKKLKHVDITNQEVLLQIIKSLSTERTFMINPLILI